MLRGTTPITKNIRVIDTMGNEYEATYPKRAKGLVKNGRAIFIDEYTLCLDCPPNDYLEDKSMNNEFLQNTVNVNDDRSNGPRPESITALEQASQGETGLTMEWVMAKMDAIIHENAYIIDAINALQTLPNEKYEMHAYGGKAQASADMVRAREETNQQVLKLLERVYDDLRPKTPSSSSPEMLTALLEQVDLNSLAGTMDSESVVNIVKVLFGKA